MIYRRQGTKVALLRAFSLASLLFVTACATPDGRFETASHNLPATYGVTVHLYEADLTTAAKDSSDFGPILQAAVADELNRRGLLAKPGAPAAGQVEVSACYSDGGNTFFKLAACLEAPAPFLGMGYEPSAIKATATILSPTGTVLAKSREFYKDTPLQSGKGKDLAEEYAKALADQLQQNIGSGGPAMAGPSSAPQLH